MHKVKIMKWIVSSMLFLLILACKKDNPSSVPSPVITGNIIFISRRLTNSADWQLFTMRADGTEQRLLSDHHIAPVKPVISHDGKQIAFTAYENFKYTLYTVGSDGNGLRQLSQSTQFCGNPSWSPDDHQILFEKDTTDIYITNARGGIELPLTRDHSSSSPSFLSSDLVIYSSFTDTISGIYSIKTDGSQKKLLTPAGQSFAQPVVSPDKTNIAITSVDWAGSQIFMMHPDGSALAQLTTSVSPYYYDPSLPRDGNNSPVWSPDSKKIAYISFENGSTDIFSMLADGSGDHRLTNTFTRDEHPSWSRDGYYIIFSSTRNEDMGAEIFIMHSDGSSQKDLTHYQADDIFAGFTDER